MKGRKKEKRKERIEASSVDLPDLEEPSQFK
jgi:hypothetical protein